MKQRNLVVQEIIDSLSNTSKFNYIGNDQYLIRVPVVGFGIDSIKLKEREGKIYVNVGEFHAEEVITFDHEYFSLLNWTVIHGECLIVLKFKLPEKYLLKDASVLPSEPNSFLKSFGLVTEAFR